MGLIGSWEGYVTSPLYLYNAGVWSNLQTTGITKMKGTCSMVSESISLLIYGTSTPESMFRLNQTFNLTTYKYLKMETIRESSDAAHNMYIGVSKSPEITSNNFVASAHGLAGSTLICDVNSLSGDYYIYVLATLNNGSQSYDYPKCKSIFLSNA